MITIAQPELGAIRRHAEEAYPQECCGVLLGRGSTVLDLVRCANVAARPERRYTIGPAELIATQRTARRRGLNIIGFYHSHPDHPAQPSAEDWREAYWNECSYVIVSVARGRADHVRSFRLGGAGFEEEAISTPPPMKTGVPLIHVEELKERLDRGDPKLFLLDVREADEYAICNLGGHLIPLEQLPARLAELDPSREIAVYCRSGARSAQAVELLIANGFMAKNVAGGILAWAEKIDPAMPKY
ncbi:MAG TPA: Mov34/MPN/PAD-1 family protein [Clostridia bacterium]|nr:Mov34/MPN/PAD-1 family protein [Clostridia bacterium]